MAQINQSSSMYNVSSALGNLYARGMNYLGLGSLVGNNSGAKQVGKNVSQTSMRIPLQRIIQSIQNWRDGQNEAEYYLPHRVKLQQLYNDLQDQSHIAACRERRMDLTLQRDFILDCGNDKDTEFWTKWLKDASWFTYYQRLVLEALFRGYTLISMGNIITDPIKGLVNALPQMKMVEHSLISPDRREVVPSVYAIGGVSWDDKPYSGWHIWVDTPPETGNGCCGFGLYNKIAVEGIVLRNNITDWAKYNEKYGMPVAHLKTPKQDPERERAFNDLKNFGSNATFLSDMEDELTFATAGGGNGIGSRTYDMLAHQLEKSVSKNILGHADVLDSISKKSGATSSGPTGQAGSDQSNTPVQQALSDIASKDGKFVQPYVNMLINLMRIHGVGIPDNAYFSYTNDAEEEETKRKEYDNITTVAQFCYNFKQAGLQVPPEYVKTETGIAVTIPEPAPPPIINKPNPSEPLPAPIKNKLNRIYNRQAAA